MDFELPKEVFVLIILLSLVAVTQFVRGRKLNLILIEYTARKLEELIKPVDKIYQWIGLYVGYRAVFKILKRYLERLEVSVILLPRQSLLYYPISLLTSRHDKIYLVYYYSKFFQREAHIIRKGYYRRSLSKVIKNFQTMKNELIVIKNTSFHLVYEDYNTVNKLLSLVKNLKEPKLINHIALVPKNKSLYIVARIKPKYFEDLILRTYELANRLT